MSISSPGYSAVAGLNINSRVDDVTSHHVVGEVRLQNVQVGIDSNLSGKTECGGGAYRGDRWTAHTNGSKPAGLPSGCSFLGGRRLCRSTDSRCWRRKCHGSPDSDPETSKHAQSLHKRVSSAFRKTVFGAKLSESESPPPNSKASWEELPFLVPKTLQSFPSEQLIRQKPQERLSLGGANKTTWHVFVWRSQSRFNV